MRVLVTGANGFVGRPLCAALARNAYTDAAGEFYQVRAATRDKSMGAYETSQIGTIDRNTDWTAAVAEVDAVIHLAARVHVMADTAADPLAEFIETNLHGSIALATQAAQAGVKRFVYVSSIKVNGEATAMDSPFRESDPPAPRDPYGESKWAAEQALRQLAGNTGMELAIVRPPLVYGPGAKGNFARLMDLVARGLPLPFRAIANKRSMIYVGNLVDALILCTTHPRAAGTTWLVADGQPVSSHELVASIAEALGRPDRDFAVPVAAMRAAGWLLRKQSAVDRLTQSLVVDDSRIRTELGWRPPYSVPEAMCLTAESYRQSP